jgi:steroid 5-alpha reductase family enzyme
MLEKKADTKWAGRPDYEAYKKRTPVLVPRPPRAALPPRSASGEAER